MYVPIAHIWWQSSVVRRRRGFLVNVKLWSLEMRLKVFGLFDLSIHFISMHNHLDSWEILAITMMYQHGSRMKRPFNNDVRLQQRQWRDPRLSWPIPFRSQNYISKWRYCTSRQSRPVIKCLSIRSCPFHFKIGNREQWNSYIDDDWPSSSSPVWHMRSVFGSNEFDLYLGMMQKFRQ